MATKVRFERRALPVGGEEFPFLIARNGEDPRFVLMTYDTFLELATTLYAAVDVLRSTGVMPVDEDEFATVPR